MNTFRANYTPGDDASPLASAVEMIDCAMARKPAPSPEEVAHVARLLLANVVSIFTAIENIERMDRVQALSVFENATRNNISALKALGLTLEEVEQAGKRMLRDAMTAAGKEGS